MRLWLVDHSGGAALVYAEDISAASTIAEGFGDVHKVVPYDKSITFELYRAYDPDDPSTREYLHADIEHDAGGVEELETELKFNRIALVGEEEYDDGSDAAKKN